MRKQETIKYNYKFSGKWVTSDQAGRASTALVYLSPLCSPATRNSIQYVPYIPNVSSLVTLSPQVILALLIQYCKVGPKHCHGSQDYYLHTPFT
jgi:hypothetical protein